MLLNRRLRYRPKAIAEDDQIWYTMPPKGIPARLPGIVREHFYRNARLHATRPTRNAYFLSPLSTPFFKNRYEVNSFVKYTEPF
jgi:hypothetical protein